MASEQEVLPTSEGQNTETTSAYAPEPVPVELDLLGFVWVVPILLDVEALVDEVFVAVLSVDLEAVETVVGVLDVEDATVVVDGHVTLEDGVVLVALTLDGDVGVSTPREKKKVWRA